MAIRVAAAALVLVVLACLAGAHAQAATASPLRTDSTLHVTAPSHQSPVNSDGQSDPGCPSTVVALCSLPNSSGVTVILVLAIALTGWAAWRSRRLPVVASLGSTPTYHHVVPPRFSRPALVVLCVSRR